MSETLLGALRVPAAKYTSPMTSSHEYGWHNQQLVSSVHNLCFLFVMSRPPTRERMHALFAWNSLSVDIHAEPDLWRDCWRSEFLFTASEMSGLYITSPIKVHHKFWNKLVYFHRAIDPDICKQLLGRRTKRNTTPTSTTMTVVCMQSDVERSDRRFNHPRSVTDVTKNRILQWKDGHATGSSTSAAGGRGQSTRSRSGADGAGSTFDDRQRWANTSFDASNLDQDQDHRM